MSFKKWTAAVALAALATPSSAFDPKDPGVSTLFYISIPLDRGLTRTEREWSAGLQLQASRYPAINLDSRMLNFLPTGGVDTKWIIAGVVAVGAAAAIGAKDKSTTAALQEQQTQQEQAAAKPPCAKPVVPDPCAK